MNKKALLDELTAKFYKIGRVAPVPLTDADIALRDEEGVVWYIAGVYEKADNRLVRKNVSFYVEADGKAEEAAFYAEKLPIDSLVKPVEGVFKDLVLSEIDKKITAEIILKGIIDTVNEDAEFAIVTVYQIENSMIAVNKYFVYEDIKKIIQFIIMAKDTTPKEII